MSRITLAPVALLALFAAREARAVDGVIEINQVRALAGGVTLGDSAGYPVTLSEPGSYRLTGSLSPQIATAITITTIAVTLDLNGFRITGTGGSCGTLHGIDATSQTDITVRNGMVDTFAGDGIRTGDRARIENVTLRNNACDGIFAGSASTVSASTAVGNTGAGIHVLTGSVVSRNTANGNTGRGLFVGDGSTVSENSVSSNGADGITTDAGCTVVHNTVRSNGGDGIEVGGKSSIIGNTVTDNTRCGVHAVADTSAWSQNILWSNNGSSSNRQASGTLFYQTTYDADTDNAFFTNVCSSGSADIAHCFTGAANNCP